MKRNLSIVMVLAANFALAQNFTFKFVYGVGCLENTKALMFYELVPNGGPPEEKVPFSISDGGVEAIKFKKKHYKEIRFSGYFYSEDKNLRRSILLISKNASSLQKNEINKVQLIGASTEETSVTPLPELINQLSVARYNELLKKPKDTLRGYSFATVRPIGRFVLYNRNSNVIQDAFTMEGDHPIFIESRKSIKDHYILKKKAGVDFSISYAKLAGITSENERNQYIEYVVSIDTLEIQHWQSKKSEMEYLYEQANAGKLDFLKTYLQNNSNWDLYFISSCVKIANFKLNYYTHDSLGSVTNVNVAPPEGTAPLSVRAGVVYSRKEGVENEDVTKLYYTGFAIRDYTSYMRDIFSGLSLNAKIEDGNKQLESIGEKVLEQFEDLRLADTTLINFANLEMVIGLVTSLSAKESLPKQDSADIEEIRKINKYNSSILSYNMALNTLKSTIIEFANAKEYLASLRTSPIQSNPRGLPTPKERPLSDSIISPLFRKSGVARN